MAWQWFSPASGISNINQPGFWRSVTDPAFHPYNPWHNSGPEVSVKYG